MLSTRAPAQVAQSVEQWTEKAFSAPQSALPRDQRTRVRNIARAIERGELSIRKARALFGVTALMQGRAV